MITKWETEGRTLYAVRSYFNHSAGVITHDYLHGTEPTVFFTRSMAEDRQRELQLDAEEIDWGHETPQYEIEEITDADLWTGETIEPPYGPQATFEQLQQQASR